MAMEIAGLMETRFDQGRFGHAYCKPTTLLTKLTNARILLRSYALAVSNKNPNSTAVAKPFRATQAHQDLSVTC